MQSSGDSKGETGQEPLGDSARGKAQGEIGTVAPTTCITAPYNYSIRIGFTPAPEKIQVKYSCSDSLILQRMLEKIGKTKDMGNAGVDLFVGSDFTILPGCRVKVSTGCKFIIPSCFMGMVTARSSANAMGIGVDLGIIDSSYRGEVYLSVRNLTDENIIWRKEVAIAQIVLLPVPDKEFVCVSDIQPDTKRGTGGFGSTDDNNNSKKIKGKDEITPGAFVLAQARETMEKYGKLIDREEQ